MFRLVVVYHGGREPVSDNSDRPFVRGALVDDWLDRRGVMRAAAAAGLGAGALSGAASADDSEQELPNTIRLEAAGTRARYEFSVSGRVAKGPEADGEERIVGENTARGVIGGDFGVDDFRFSGRITSFSLDGPATVLVNGEAVDDPVGLPAPDLPNVVTIQARGQAVEYQFTVTGRIATGPEADDEERIVDGTTARGVVGGDGVDDFRYSGSISFDRIDRPVRVCLDLGE